MHDDRIRFARLRLAAAFAALVTMAVAAQPSLAQEAARPPQPPAPAGRGAMPPPVVSPEVASDGRITFRLFAPQAQTVRLSASDIPGMMGPAAAAAQAARADSGVWSVTVGPLDPGAYRYTFNVDGVSTVDPRNPVISESNNNVWSLVVVPGSEVFDTKDVPRGAVAAITYRSTALGVFRRMHVYTPPGYESGRGSFPVFYLLHGAGDNDDAWSSVGRAGFILDNLIAAKRARPMIVVMPAGHTSRGPGSPIGRGASADFVNDFVKDVMPYVETHYRVITDRAHTAIAGLSMGGGQTLSVAIPRLERFGYIAVFSSGLLGAFPELSGRGRGPAPPAPAATPPVPSTTAAAAAAPAPPAPPPAAAADAPPTAAEWERLNAATIDSPALKKGLRLLWFGTGKDDFLLTTTQATVELFRKHGFTPVFRETPGGHTWINWRQYLAEVAPQLFQTAK